MKSKIRQNFLSLDKFFLGGLTVNILLFLGIPLLFDYPFDWALASTRAFSEHMAPRFPIGANSFLWMPALCASSILMGSAFLGFRFKVEILDRGIRAGYNDGDDFRIAWGALFSILIILLFIFPFDIAPYDRYSMGFVYHFPMHPFLLATGATFAAMGIVQCAAAFYELHFRKGVK